MLLEASGGWAVSGVAHSAHVPFARKHSAIPRTAKYVGNRCHTVGQDRFITALALGLWRPVACHRAKSGIMRRGTREQGGAGGRTGRVCVKVCQPHTGLSEAVEVRGPDFRSE